MWLYPLTFGLFLIGFGVLVLFMPELLAFLVAFAVIFIGVTLLGFSFTLRSNTKVRTFSSVNWNEFERRRSNS